MLREAGAVTVGACVLVARSVASAEGDSCGDRVPVIVAVIVSEGLEDGVATQVGLGVSVGAEVTVAAADSSALAVAWLVCEGRGEADVLLLSAELWEGNGL